MMMRAESEEQLLGAEIPHHLLEVDRVMTAFGRWAMDRWAPRQCGSAEGNFRSSEVFAGLPQREILMRDFRAADVQRALIQLPELERRLLTAWYVPKRGQVREIRQLVRSHRGWPGFSDALARALTMFRNCFVAECGLVA